MMHKEKMLNAMKKALQGEKDSYALYSRAAESSQDPQVRDFFTGRAEEEKRHYNYLLKYHAQVSGDQPAGEVPSELSKLNELPQFFGIDFIQRIGADQYLFSAISTALLLEKYAFEHYRQLEDMADSLTLKSFFGLLAAWEVRHYDELLAIQKEAELYYWEVNDFEPM